ncbi:MAG: glycosyl hydrolase family 28 protein, partial [Planctomycetota bacterium]
PWRMVSFLECRNVLLEDVTLRNSPAYTVWPCGCDDVRIRGIRLFNNLRGPNTDGIDPDCSSNVTISDCIIECGDDCIALKSDADRLGRAKACENVTVTNCVLTTTCCAIRVGYEGDAPIRNCTFSNLVIARSRTGINMLVPRHAEAGIHHGPTIENIRFSNLVMDTTIPIYLWIGDDASAPGAIRNVSISDCFATTERACYIGGAKHLPIEDVRISNFRLEVRGETDDEFSAEVPYPYRVWDYFNKKGIPHGFYCRHVRGLEFHDVRVAWGKVSGPWRSALRAEQIEDLDLHGFVARQAPGPADAPAIHLTDARGVSLRGCRAAPGTGTFLRLDGPAAGRASLSGNDLAAAKTEMDRIGAAP